MASESMFESFPSYPQCFMRGEYAPYSAQLSLRELSRGAGPRAVGLEGGIETRACDYKAIGLPAPWTAALQRRLGEQGGGWRVVGAWERWRGELGCSR